ncbi:unknown [Firmicutes bacterium CAG:103]|nr:unknown [Firmicutes bacterium CAG:103]
MELVDKALDLSMALVDLRAFHEAGALVPVQVVAADGVKRGLAVLDLDALTAREAAEAVAVGHDHGAAALEELRELGIVDLGAGDHDARAEGEFRLGLALFDLGKRLLQVREDQVVRADLAHELDDVELIAGNGRVGQLAEVADLGDDIAQLVELLDGRAHGGIGGVHAVALGELVDDLELELALVVVIAGLIALERGIDLRDEEAVVLHGIDEEEMLFHTLHGRAALGAEERVEVVVAALNGALEDGADIRADTAGHVVGRNVGRLAARRAQAAREAARQVEQNLGDVITVVPEGDFPVVDRLRDEFVLRILQEIFEENQMFQVFHIVPSFKIIPIAAM